MAPRLLQYADIENAYDDPERIGRLAGLIEHLRDDETVVCGVGDNTAPGVLSLVTRGRQALDFYRAVEPDAEVFGNHDFDYGIEATRGLVRDSPQPWLGANVFEDGERFATREGAAPHRVVETAAHRIGLVGVATPNTPVMTPQADELDFTDPVVAAAESVEEIREEVAYVVVLSHCGDDTELATALDVDAILGGHDHTAHVERVAGTLVARPGANGRRLLAVELDDGEPTVTAHTVMDGPLDENVESALRERMDETGLSESVTTLDRPLGVERRDLFGESRVGNFVTDALRWRAGTEVAMLRAGIREVGSLSGTVTAADLIGVLPFDNDLAVLELSGEQLLESFRECDHSYRYPEVPDRRVGHISGASLVWDEPGTLAEARVGDEPLDTEATYSVAVDFHHVESNHLFSAFDERDVVLTVGTAYEALIEYAREFGIDPEIEGRIRRPSIEHSEVR